MRRRVDLLGDGGGEGDDVVADLVLDFVDASDGEVAADGDGVGGSLGDEAERARAWDAAVSTVSQQRNLFSSDQMRPMAGRV